MALTDTEKHVLVQIARCSIESAVRGTRFEFPPDLPSALQEKCGAFVTIHNHGELRGCIGYIEGFKPLAETVAEVAEKAALEDVRFLPVATGEIPELDIEISVMSTLHRIKSIDEIVVGTHGLLITHGRYRGLLLPQVATEQKWDRETFLSQTCRKAGLMSDMWKSPVIQIFTFTVELIHGSDVIDSSRRKKRH